MDRDIGTTPASEPTGANAGPSDAVRAILERIDQSWLALQAAIDGVPEERMTEPGVCGEWSVKDLLGHVAVWDAYVVAVSRRFLAGEVPGTVDWEGINEREAAARVDRSVAEQRAEMDRVHAAMVEFVAALQPKELRTKGVRPRIRVDTYEHYDEHATDIRAWRERVGV